MACYINAACVKRNMHKIVKAHNAWKQIGATLPNVLCPLDNAQLSHNEVMFTEQLKLRHHNLPHIISRN